MGGFLREPMFWVVVLIAILLFGAKRLPDAARGLGRSLRVFKAETESLRTDGSTIPADPQAVTGAPVTTEPVVASPTPVSPPVPAAPPVAPAVQAVPVAPVAPVASPAPRYLVDPVTGEQILAQPVQPPADGAPRA